MTEDREVKNYEKLAERAKQMFESSKEKSGAWIDEALEKAADQVEEAGRHVSHSSLPKCHKTDYRKSYWGAVPHNDGATP
jgi:hypothetical protein